MESPNITVAMATESDLESIFRMRHEVYATELEACQKQGLYLRDVGMTAPTLGGRAVRIAVKDAATNRRMVDILQRVMLGQ